MSAHLELVSAFFEAFRAKNLHQAPLGEDVRYESPLNSEPVCGRDNVVRFIGAYIPVVTGVNILRLLSDEHGVAAHFEADTLFGVLSLVYLFRIQDDRIVEILAFYDPRQWLDRIGEHGNSG